MALPCRLVRLSGQVTKQSFCREVHNFYLRGVYSRFTTLSPLHRCLSTGTEFSECENRVYSGIQPTGVPHIGNYAGAIVNWIRLQKTYKGRMLLNIADLHSITIPPQEGLRQNIVDLTACLLACGLDPDKIILFQQSMVPYHTQLAWILSCLCSVPKIQRMPQWKEKKSKVKDPSVGLLTYPILQAADILLYKSTLVPVGEDQTHHIELTRDLARAFNREYGMVFPSCQMVPGEITKIRSLRNPTNKMSKSEANTKSRIELLDSPEEIAEKVKKAVTDFTSEVTYDPENRPGVSNLVEIHAALGDMCIEDIVEESFLMAEDTSLYKKRLSDVINEKLSPIREKALEYKRNEDYLWDVLQTGANKASAIAESTMEEVKSCIGMS